jgi:cellulose synthase/poly-beta-1,6-N-acetylglucosamine synthase-like glycosyltransferase
VIVAADGDPAGVAATLGAVAVSRFDDFEVVIADAGADAQIGEATREWMDAHPYIAARLVSAPDPALGVLRNAAVDGARGQLCLVLDAGSLIYPRGVDVLVDVLRDDPDLSFAYPIQDVAGDHLTSYRRWHAWLLHRSDDLRAPALIRADRLRDLGGFTTEGAARGHEDLDLWSRMAARGWRGELVPQPVARRLAPLQS